MISGCIFLLSKYFLAPNKMIPIVLWIQFRNFFYDQQCICWIFHFNKFNHLFDTVPIFLHVFFFENDVVSAIQIQSDCNILKFSIWNRFESFPPSCLLSNRAQLIMIYLQVNNFQLLLIEILYRISIHISVQDCQKEFSFSSRQKMTTKIVDVKYGTYM